MPTPPSPVRDRRDRHAIIGAGFSGLGVAAAFQRSDIPFDVFEADDDLGGNWYHGVYDTVHIISSRRTTEYSDFPMPAGWPDFPSKDQMLQYLRSYANHHGLRPRIRFETRVVHVSPADSGCWNVELEIGERLVYGGVVIANGHHWDRRWPAYPGRFEGEMIHAKDYKRPDVLVGKRVLVIGGGNSACDIAVEAARFAETTHISMRRGYWFLPKTMLGVPTVELMKPWMPIVLQRIVLKILLRIIVGRYETYGLAHPDHRIFERHPTVNSELMYFLRHGRITAQGDIERFEGRWVLFTDGTAIEVDLIVAATGYHLSFPFLETGIIQWQDGLPDLIDGIVPRRHKNLYVFGLGQPRYGAGPLITAGAETLCTMIETQAQLELPLGQILERLGRTSLDTLLLDPHEMLRKARRAKRVLSRLPKWAPVLMNEGSKASETWKARVVRALFPQST